MAGEFCYTWGLEHVLGHPWAWQRSHETHPWLRDSEVLDLWRAKRALDEIASEERGRELLREIAAEVLLGFYVPSARPWPGSYEAQIQDARMIERLKEEALGTIFSKPGEPPHFACFYICSRKLVAPKPEPFPDPWQDTRQAIEQAKQAVRGFVAIEAASEAGDPVSSLRFEVLLADGEVLTRSTDARGQLRLEPIPQGRCTIRVPGFDGSAWHPAEGAPASQIERGHKQLHIVKHGENLTRIAQRYGFKGWRKLWDAPENEKLRKKRGCPNVLRPGDEVVIPALAIYEITRPSDQTHRIVVAEAKIRVRVRLQDLAQKPLTQLGYDYGYTLDVGGKREERHGSAPTDVDGWLEERIPARATTLLLRLRKPKLELELPLSTFEPAYDPDTKEALLAGVHTLLSFRGYASGPRGNGPSPERRRALATYQTLELARKDASGEPDEETLQSLESPLSEAWQEPAGEEELSLVVATLSRIRLGCLTGPYNAWRFEPLPAGAHTLLKRISSAEPAPLMAARVGEDGLLYQLDPQDKASRSSDVLLYLRAADRYQVWWTLDEERYAEALEDPQPWLDAGSIIEVQQYARNDDAPLQGEIEAFDRRHPDAFYMRTEVRHVISHHILHRHAFHESREEPIFDVTPTCVRALFTAELMHWYTLEAHEASANDLATFQHAAAMIQAAEKGLRDTALERRATELFPGEEERRAFDLFRDYAWRCAATGMPKELFENSIAMHEGPSDLPEGGVPNAADGGVPAAPDGGWLDCAIRIRDASAGEKHGPALPPYLQGISGPSRGFVREGVTLTIAQQKLLRDYYESYLFGAQLRTTQFDGVIGFQGQPEEHDYHARMDRRVEDWNRQAGELERKTRALLERQAPSDLFLLTVASCYPQDADLVDRYIEATAACGLPWWESLSVAERKAAPSIGPDGTASDGSWPFWKTFKARIKPLAETLKGTGKVSKLLSERIEAYDLSLKEARALLDTVGRLEVTLGGGEVDAQRHVVRTDRNEVRLIPTGDAGEVQVAFRGAERKPGAPSSVTLRFVRRTTAQPLAEAGHVQTGVVRSQHWEPVAKADTYHVEVPANLDDLRELGRYPKPFAVLADTLNLAIAVATVTGEASGKEKAFATFDLMKSVVSVVESFPAAVAAMRPPLESSALLKGAAAIVSPLKDVATWLGRIDNVFKLYKGAAILFGDQADVQYELRNGRLFRAELQHYSDLANVVVGAVATVDLAGT
ncbi:MAG TPA: LysM domain-containing protein, partial [Polyangiaceae bacterium]|nr:LysM domain-containing protein [Polyangiaceae bacterium]